MHLCVNCFNKLSQDHPWLATMCRHCHAKKDDDEDERTLTTAEKQSGCYCRCAAKRSSASHYSCNAIEAASYPHSHTAGDARALFKQHHTLLRCFQVRAVQGSNLLHKPLSLAAGPDIPSQQYSNTRACVGNIDIQVIR